MNKDEQFDISYDKYADMLYKIAYLHTGNHSESEDIVQEIFIKLLYKSPNFRNEEHEKAWLIRSITNQCKDYLKSSRHSNMPLNEEIVWGKDFDDDKRLDIRRKIIALEDKYKTAVYLFYYEDYTVEKIAEILKISKSAVKMRLSRARKLLKKELEDYSDE